LHRIGYVLFVCSILAHTSLLTPRSLEESNTAVQGNACSRIKCITCPRMIALMSSFLRSLPRYTAYCAVYDKQPGLIPSFTTAESYEDSGIVSISRRLLGLPMRQPLAVVVRDESPDGMYSTSPSAGGYGGSPPVSPGLAPGTPTLFGGAPFTAPSESPQGTRGLTPGTPTLFTGAPSTATPQSGTATQHLFHRVGPTTPAQTHGSMFSFVLLIHLLACRASSSVFNYSAHYEKLADGMQPQATPSCAISC
jgi:hypothetical protein